MCEEMKLSEGIEKILERFNSLENNAILSRVADNRSAILVSVYEGLHDSVNKIHERIDRLSQGYIISAGAVYALYFSNTDSAPQEILLVPTLLAFLAAYQISNMWRVAARTCFSAAHVETIILREGEPKPARQALKSFYYSSFYKEETMNGHVEANEDFCFWRRAISSRSFIWILFLGLSVLLYCWSVGGSREFFVVFDDLPNPSEELITCKKLLLLVQRCS